MKILLTGSDGYIGTQMLQVLRATGHEVTGFDTGYYNDGWLYGKPIKPAFHIQKDIRKVEVSDVAGFDAVIHLAELSNDPLSQVDPLITEDINHNGTVKLIDACIKAGVPRFLYASSCTVYGASDVVRDESSQVNPITAYGQCKVLNEQYLLKLANDAFCPIIFRNATVFGPSPRMRFDIAVNNLSGLAWTTKEIKMDSDGTPWRPFVHVLDVCEAFKLALVAPTQSVRGQIMNVGNTQSNYQIKDVAEIIGKVFGVSKITFNPQGADKRNYRVNFDKIKKILPKFECKRNVQTGASELKEIFESIQMNSDIFLSKEYTRLKMITYLKSEGKIDESLHWRL